jgi:hypothetical protein
LYVAAQNCFDTVGYFDAMTMGHGMERAIKPMLETAIKDPAFEKFDREIKIHGEKMGLTSAVDQVFQSVTQIVNWLSPKFARDQKTRQPLQILPLIMPRAKKMFVAGLDGAKGMDPFSADEAYWYKKILKLTDIMGGERVRTPLKEEGFLGGISNVARAAAEFYNQLYENTRTPEAEFSRSPDPDDVGQKSLDRESGR